MLTQLKLYWPSVLRTLKMSRYIPLTEMVKLLKEAVPSKGSNSAVEFAMETEPRA